MREIDVRCAVCGALSRTVELTSTSSFGPPDLDLRPSEPARSALPFRVQRCDAYGYAARSIGTAPPQARATVESNVYRDVLERSRMPGLARSFFGAALVSEAAGEPEGAAWRFLEAAWACDDKDARSQARICRERAAEKFVRALEMGETETPQAVVHTVVADLWRRAGRFDESIASCEAAAAALEEPSGGDEDGTAAVVSFIWELALAGEDDARSCAEVFARGEE